MNRNPNHKVSQAVEGQWHKICAFIMVKLKLKEFIITTEDINEMAQRSEGMNIAVHDDGNRIRIYMVDNETADRLARENGGLPI